MVKSWTRNLVPSGVIDVLLQSNMPWRDAYADNFVLKRQLQKRFKVKVDCGSKLSHSLAGYSELAAQRYLIKCALDFWIELSAALYLRRYGATNW